MWQLKRMFRKKLDDGTRRAREINSRSAGPELKVQLVQVSPGGEAVMP